MEMVVKDDRIHMVRLALGPFSTNGYILICPHTGESVIIDAPAEEDKIVRQLKETRPKYLLITHNHMDHLGAFSGLRSRLKIPVGIHPLDSKALPSSPEILLGDGDMVSFGKVELKVLHTPGHTPGSVCFLMGLTLISGDTIFPGGPGKTRSPSDLKQIIESITKKIFVLPDETHIYPGHGKSAVLKKEKTEFAIFASHPHDPNLCGDVLWLSS
jgi:hydroxyacylglutathione hydrolase